MLEVLQRWLTGYAPAQVVSSDQEVHEDQDFRLPGDPPYLIRVRQNPPEAADRLFNSVRVAGTSRKQEAVDSFVAGRAREIDLRHGTAGPNDLTTIQVIGLWDDQCGILHRRKLGWLSVETISEIERRYPGIKLIGRVQSLTQSHRTGRSEIRLEIWGRFTLLAHRAL